MKTAEKIIVDTPWQRERNALENPLGEPTPEDANPLTAVQLAIGAVIYLFFVFAALIAVLIVGYVHP